MHTTTRQNAAKEGLHKYFTGKACNNGHLTYRYVNSGVCITCAKIHLQKYKNKKYTYISFRVHPDDVLTLKSIVESLNMARGLTI